MLNGENGSLGTVGDAELIHNRTDMIPHSALGKKQLFRNIFVAQPFRQQLQYFDFALRQFAGNQTGRFLFTAGNLPYDFPRNRRIKILKGA